jgi:hypothetical protein
VKREPHGTLNSNEKNSKHLGLQYFLEFQFQLIFPPLLTSMFILQKVAFTYLQSPIVQKKSLNMLIQNFFMCIQKLSED